MAGFLLITVGSNLFGLASVLLSCGTGFFEIFMFAMLAALASKNPIAALPLFAWGDAMGSWGTILGANFGRNANGTATLGLSGIDTVALIVFAIVAYVIIPKKGINFTETIRQLTSPELVVANEGSGSAPQRLEERCRRLGESCGLTDREQQVFEYLARGRNVWFIQEELVVSYNTVKTHVSHIYTKLGVHSHQELINLVEQQ